MPKTLTPSQNSVFNFIQNYLRERGFAPSYREIASGCNLKSISTVQSHVKTLEEKNYLRLDPEEHGRGIRLSPEYDFKAEAVYLPLAGLITAGQPIEIIDTANSENRVAVPRELVTNMDCFVLRVQGDSMLDEGIWDQDLVVIEKNFYPRNGQAVVAVLADNTATLKKFYREKGRFRLQPANEKYQPIYTKKVEIRGVVRAVLRIYT